MPLTMAIEILRFRKYMHRKGVEYLMVNMQSGYFLANIANFKSSITDSIVKLKQLCLK